MASTLIAKITPSSIGLKPEIVKESGQEVVLAHMLGQANGTKIKRAANGDEFVALAGKFEAHNLSTGEVYRSGILFLPSGIHDFLTEVLTNDPDAVIDFAVALVAFPAKNPSGYSWKLQQLFKQEADPLADLRARLESEMKSKDTPLLGGPAETIATGSAPKQPTSAKRR